MRRSQYEPPRVCRVPGCSARLHAHHRVGICPSCRFVGKAGLFLGGLLGGALGSQFPHMKELFTWLVQ